MLDTDFYARRRHQACYFWVSRLSIVIAFLAILCIQLWYVIQTRQMIEEDRLNVRGGNIQVLADNVAGEQITSGSVVSYDADGTLQAGIGVSSLAKEVGSSSGLRCSNAEISAQTCLWKKHQGGEAVVQFQLVTLGGASTYASQIEITKFDLATGTSTTQTPSFNMSNALSNPTTTGDMVESLQVLEGAAATSAGTDVSVALLYSETTINGTSEVGQQYILASYSRHIGSASSTTVLQSLAKVSKTTQYDLGTSRTGPRGFVHVLPAGILVGVQCGFEQCCLALLDAQDPSMAPLAEKVFPDTDCPSVVALLGDSYVAFGSSPVLVLRAYVDSLGAAFLSLQQVVHLPWGSSSLIRNILTVPSSHTYARFILVAAVDGLIRCFYVIPTDTSVLDSTATGSATAFRLQLGVMQTTAHVADGLPVEVEAAVFVSPTLEVQFILKAGSGTKYMGRISLQYTVTSELIFLEDVSSGPTTAVQMLVYVAHGTQAGTILSFVPGDSPLSSRTMQTTLAWYGGYSIAGVSQNNAYAGESVTVLRGGSSAVHTGLVPGRKYQSGENGVLVPYRGGSMISDGTWAAASSGQLGGGGGGSNGGFPPHYGMSSHYLVVGTAESSTVLRVFLR